MSVKAELTNNGELKIEGNLNERLPVITDGLVAHFPFDGTDKGIKFNELIDYSTWVLGSVGSQPGFYGNGDGNSIIEDIDPFGRKATIWQTLGNDVDSGPDGGWNTDLFDIDNTKLYRYSVWFNRRVYGDGRFYFGVRGYTDGSNTGVIYNDDGETNQTNPYFWYSSVTATELPKDEWVLIVGHVYPYDHTDTSMNVDSGIYNVTGKKILDIYRDFRWRTDSNRSLHRTYLYYSTLPETHQLWCYPRVDICDGTEPTLDDLLMGVNGEGNVDNNIKNRKYLTVYAQDYTYETKDGVWENETRIIDFSRDWNLIVWDRVEGKFLLSTEFNNYGADRILTYGVCFDVYGNTVEEAQAFCDTVYDLDPNRHIVIIAGSHAPEKHTSAMDDAIKYCGGTSVNLNWTDRKSYICVGAVGCGEGNAIIEVLDNIDTTEAKTSFFLYKDKPNESLTNDGIAIEEATTNLLPNGAFVDDISGWSHWQAYGNTLSNEIIDDPRFGKILRLKNDCGTASCGITPNYSMTNGVTYTISYWIRIIKKAPSYNYIYYVTYDSEGTKISGYIAVDTNLDLDLIGEWQYVHETFTATFDGTVALRARIHSSDGDYVYSVVDFANVQVETKAYPTSFVDGSRSNGFVNLDPNLIDINHGAFSVEFYWEGEKYSNPSNKWMMITHPRSNIDPEYNKINICISNGIVRTRIANDGSTTISTGYDISELKLNNWNRYAVTWDKTTGYLQESLNGVLKSISCPTTPTSIPDIFYFGSWHTYGLWANMRMKNFSIYNKYLSENELKTLTNPNFNLQTNGNLIQSDIKEKPNITDDVYYFPLGNDICDEYKNINNPVLSTGDGVYDINIKNTNEILPVYIKIDDNGYWLRVFYHYNNAGTILFADDIEATETNINNPTNSKYSILSKLSNFIGSDGKYTFMLRYSEYMNRTNVWKQSSNPVSEAISGYEEIDIMYSGSSFGGIAISSSTTSTFLDCSPNDGSWYFAIGAKATWGGAIPGPGVAVNYVELYVKIEDMENLRRLYSNVENVVYENGSVWVGEETTNVSLNDGQTTTPWYGDGLPTLISVDEEMTFKGRKVTKYHVGTSKNCYINGSGDLRTDILSTNWAVTCYMKRLDGESISSIGSYLYITNNTNVNITVYPEQVGGGWYKITRERTGLVSGYPTLMGFYNMVDTTDYFIADWQVEPRCFQTPFVFGNRPKSDLEFNLHESIGLDWNGNWTITYKKKPIGTYGNTLTGYNIESLGCNSNSVGGGYRWWGKTSGSDVIRAHSINLNSFYPNDYFNLWQTVMVRKSEDNITWRWVLNNGVVYENTQYIGAIANNYFVTQYGYDFKLGGWDNSNVCNTYFKDLVIANRAMSDDEIDNIYKNKMSIEKDGTLRIQDLLHENFEKGLSIGSTCGGYNIVTTRDIPIKIRKNSATSKIEFSEDGISWAQLGG